MRRTACTWHPDRERIRQRQNGRPSQMGRGRRIGASRPRQPLWIMSLSATDANKKRTVEANAGSATRYLENSNERRAITQKEPRVTRNRASRVSSSFFLKPINKEVVLKRGTTNAFLRPRRQRASRMQTLPGWNLRLGLWVITRGDLSFRWRFAIMRSSRPLHERHCNAHDGGFWRHLLFNTGRNWKGRA